jgi:hypothetical protein
MSDEKMSTDKSFSRRLQTLQNTSLLLTNGPLIDNLMSPDQTGSQFESPPAKHQDEDFSRDTTAVI